MRRVSLNFGTGHKSRLIASFRYGSDFRSVAGKSEEECRAKATAIWGKPDALELISTPNTIYDDLTGATAERARQHGLYTTSNAETW